MFTGIVQQIGTVHEVDAGAPGLRLGIRSAYNDLSLGGSIAVDGACLTVARVENGAFWVDASPESLRVTTLGARHPGERVHLERALRIGDELGGHFVTGHVDAVGRVVGWSQAGGSVEAEIALDANLRRFVAPKGSITVDGVSLTVNALTDRGFAAMLVPYTLEQTTFAERGLGTLVNLEVDVLARYLARLHLTIGS